MIINDTIFEQKFKAYIRILIPRRSQGPILQFLQARRTQNRQQPEIQSDFGFSGRGVEPDRVHRIHVVFLDEVDAERGLAEETWEILNLGN